MTDPLVILADVRRRRGEFELQVPTWSVAPGQVVGVVGPNGVGKTTLLRLLAGLDPLSSGTLKVLGQDPVRKHEAVRSAVAFMSDDQPVFNIAIGKLLHLLSGYHPTWDTDLVESLLTRFNLDPDRRAGNLSRGEGTRLRLLLALAFRPRLILLDEPAAGLDLGGRQALLESVVEVAGAGDRSVIISSHQLIDIQRVCDRLLVLNQGRVIREGPTNELVRDDQTLEEAMIEWGAA